MPYKLFLNDEIMTKKEHPCGSNRFKVERCGMDFLICCSKCQKNIWISRQKLEKRIKKIFRNGEELERELW